MDYNKLQGVDKPVARLVQGTVMLKEATRDANQRLFDKLFERGFTTFDTAHNYGRGEVERELGRWIQSRGIRDDVVILSKGAHPYPPEEPQRVTPDHIRSDLADSLDRLQTDFVDMYVLHRDNSDFPVGELVDALNEAKDKGYIRCFGGSNWTMDRIKAANEYAAANNLTPFTMSSPQFSVAEMVKEPWAGCISVSGEQGEAARVWYEANQISLFTWSSLAGGFMTGKFNRNNLETFSSYDETTTMKAYAYENNFKRLDRVKELAKDKSATVPQISVAYVLQNPRTHAIIANWEIEQIDENLKALDIKLSPDEIAWLELKTEAKPS